MEELSTKHAKIWYLIDGVYSMYGDFAPIHEITELLETYEKLHLYADDAHGMSWYGKNGKGYILSHIEKSDKIVVATSFAKAFGAGGGVFVFPNEELFQKVKNCGGPFIFSGPHQVPVIGALIASAKIHLSKEIYHLQHGLSERITYCHSLLKSYNLPVISSPETPIFFIGCGLIRVGYNFVKKMIDSGFYVNISAFPAVPETCTGLRFTITLHHTFEDIELLVKALAKNLPLALAEEERSINDIHHSFRKVASFSGEKLVFVQPHPIEMKKEQLQLQHETSIKNIPQKIWDGLLNNGSTFDWNGLCFLEDTFSKNEEKHNNWKFHYFIIRDEHDVPVLATYFTVALLKDDMLSSKSISQQIESQRKNDPYYLSTNTMMMGCSLSLGNHLYIDKNHKYWKKSLMLLIDTVWKEQDREKAEVLNLRDFNSEDTELCDFLTKQGFLQIPMPEAYSIDQPIWKDSEEYLLRFTGKRRYNLKQEVIKPASKFLIKVVQDLKEADPQRYYELYCNVAEKGMEVSSFKLPFKLFKNMLNHPQWEIIELRLASDNDSNNGKIIGVDICYKNSGSYEFLCVGIDYDYLESHNVYKQAMWQAISRANQLKSTNVNLGVTAGTSKSKFGAKAVKNVAFVQMKDHFNMNLIEIMSNSLIAK